MTKKLVVLGKGTAGALAMSHYAKWLSDYDLEWHYDPLTPTQAVGEGSTLGFPSNLYENLNFTHNDLKHIDGSFKSGISKDGWGENGGYHFHDFTPPFVSYHFNAIKLQEYIYSKLKDKVKLVEHNTTSDAIDADFVMDCSGRPTTFEDFDIPKYVPVNAVYVTQCYWNHPEFQYTLSDARPHGWVFGIPLQNRCSIGYMYNKDITTLEEVKEDVKHMFKKYNLTPSETTNSFSFNNYKRKMNYTDRIAYNGNASFFLEPLEATSISMMNVINRSAYEVWVTKKPVNLLNDLYHTTLTQIERFLMMHYFAGSSFKTPFWEFAQERGARCMEEAKTDEHFKYMIAMQKKAKSVSDCSAIKVQDYGVWWLGSFYQTIKGLDIEQKLEKVFS